MAILFHPLNGKLGLAICSLFTHCSVHLFFGHVFPIL